ncbi:hypothetical protein FGE12_04180 [Aggregicoccus sp. 17bor-14]|uniref:SEC-C metal-binding domain-containing protein n=1 Tax=Myxococcaceae TaxID=31 RepID=UPI00129C207E|nr:MULTISPECIES: SEC-C metal-binding domain-containing protein [Myxococcaceae]MRI87358.1 hypothetical protein [Aggregicoccus sp. 17bor-14]
MKVSRNAPCPCGSGRKYKLCHGRGHRSEWTTGTTVRLAFLVTLLLAGLVLAVLSFLSPADHAAPRAEAPSAGTR